MNLSVALVLSIVSILFLLVGTFIVFTTKNNNKVMIFSVALGFIVLLLLGFMHLMPDAFSFFRESMSGVYSVLSIILCTFLGFVVLFVLDLFGGHHHEHEHEEDHYEHISIITCIFLVLHNFIEGMTLYSSVLLDYKTAIILTLGIGLHNIPLGFTLSSTYNKSHSKVKTIFYIVFIGLSYLFGALLAYKFNRVFVSDVVLGVALMFTFGMILYIACFEFLPDLIKTNEKKVRNLGILVGVVSMILTLFL